MWLILNCVLALLIKEAMIAYSEDGTQEQAAINLHLQVKGDFQYDYYSVF